MTDAALDVNDRYRALSLDAGQTDLPYDFPLLAEADLTVILDRGGEMTPLTEGVDFIFPLGLGTDAGGTAQLVVAAQADDIYHLVGEEAIERVSEFMQQQGFDTEKLDADLDKLTRIAQEARRDIDRSLKVALGSPTLEPLPSPAAGKLLEWRVDGKGLANTSKSIADLDQADAALRADLTAEGAARAAGDSGLQADLAVEASARAAAYAALRSLIGQAGPIEVPVFDTRLAASLANIKSTIQAIRTNGYAAAGDGGDVLYKRVAAEPAHEGKFQSSDGAWWEIAEKTIRPEMFGAAGDGVDPDEAAVQVAATVAVAIGATVAGSGSYRIAAPVVIPSDFHFDGGKGAEFIKDFVSVDGNADAMFVNGNYGALAPDGDVTNVSICNVLLKTADSTATSALVSFVNVNGLVLDNVKTEKTSQGFAIHLSGQNIEIRGVRPTSEGPSTNIDGLHFNWVKNLTIDGIIADTEDDCLAFTADPTTWTGSGPTGMVAQDIVINNSVLRSKAGGFRIGNGIITGGETEANTVDPDLAFRRIVVSNTLIEKTDTTGSTLAFEDTRSNANAKHTDISFVNCRIRMTGAARLVNLLGNDDPANAAKTWKNYGSIEFKDCYFECGLGEIFAGASSSSVGGAFDVLRLLDCWIVRTAESTVDNSFNLRNFGAIEVRNLRFRDKIAGPRPFFLREYDRILMSDIFYENESTGADAAAFLAPDNPNVGSLIVLEGVTVKGDIQYRVQGALGSVTIPSLYVTGGAAETTVGDISANVSFTTGQVLNPAKSMAAATMPANFSADRRIAVQIDGTTYYVPAATAVW